MKKAFILRVLLITVFFLAACARQGVHVAISKDGLRTVKAVAVEKSIEEFSEKTKVIRALGWVGFSDGEEERQTDAVFVIERPGSARVDAIDQLADVWASAGTDGKKLWLYVPGKSKLYSGRASGKNLYRLAKFGWEVPELISILAGSPPIVGKVNVMQTGEPREWHFVAGEKNLHMWYSKKTGTVEKCMRYNDDGNRIDFIVYFGNWHGADGVMFPHRIEATFPDSGAKIVAVYKDVLLGENADAAIFTSPLRPSAKTVELK